MRCPKCKLLTFEGNTTCPRCGEDLRALAEKFGPFYEFTVEEVFLKDSLITPSSFMPPPPPPGPPSEEVPSGEEFEPTEHPLPVEPLAEKLTREESPATPPSSAEEADLFRELEEALREDQG